jgi:hypothetical protein
MNWTERRKWKSRKRRAGRFLTAVAAAGGVVGLIGLCFPIEHVTSGSLLLDRPPEIVWRVLTDFDGMPLWRSDLTGLERLPDLAGKPAWREISRAGNRVLELSLAEPPRRLVMRRSVNGRPGLPSRTFELVEASRGTLLTLAERGEVPNPLLRVLVRIRAPRGEINRFLRDLDRRLNANQRQVATAGKGDTSAPPSP